MNTLNPFAPVAERPSPAGLQELDFHHSKKLLGVARHTMNAGYALIEFVDSHRDVARQTGVETIAIELSGMIDSGRIDSVADALHDSVLSGSGTRLSEEGLANLRRAERLLSDAAANLKRYGDAYTMARLSGSVMGQSFVGPGSAPASSGFLDIKLTDILIIVAIAVLIGILLWKR
jgi:hypothetical protein